MNKLYTLIAVTMLLLTISSCKKEDEDADAGKLPNIAFKTGGNYVSANKSVGLGDTIMVGISASKAEDKDVLITFDAAKALDGGTAASFYTETLTGSLGDAYSKDLQIITRKQAGVETYTFTVVNRDGLKNSVTLVLTVI